MNRTLILTAVRQHGYALQYAGKFYRRDKEIVLTAVKQNGYVILDAHKKCLDDREIVLNAIKGGCNIFDKLVDRKSELLDDAEIILSGCRYCKQYTTSIYSVASDRLKNDRETVLKATQYDRNAFKYANDLLKNDKNIVFQAIKNHIDIFRYASDKIKNDREFVIKAIKHNIEAYYYAGNIVRCDKEIAQMVADGKRSYRNFKYEKYITDGSEYTYIITIELINDRLRCTNLIGEYVHFSTSEITTINHLGCLLSCYFQKPKVRLIINYKTIPITMSERPLSHIQEIIKELTIN
jgi:hypothetical protein